MEYVETQGSLGKKGNTPAVGFLFENELTNKTKEHVSDCSEYDHSIGDPKIIKLRSKSLSNKQRQHFL